MRRGRFLVLFFRLFLEIGIFRFYLLTPEVETEQESRRSNQDGEKRLNEIFHGPSFSMNSKKKSTIERSSWALSNLIFLRFLFIFFMSLSKR